MTTTLHSPTAGRRRLRHALRQARDAAGLTQEQVAEAMDWSLSKVIRIETGAVSISTSDLRQLLQLYGVVDEQQVAELVELARIGRRKPWWARYRDVVPPAYLAYVGLEDEAAAIANGTPYGLSGGVFSGDQERGVAFARRMRTGMVDVNGGRFNPLAPFGGYKQSGTGRELGQYGLEEFLEVKSLQL